MLKGEWMKAFEVVLSIGYQVLRISKDFNSSKRLMRNAARPDTWYLIHFLLFSLDEVL